MSWNSVRNPKLIIGALLVAVTAVGCFATISADDSIPTDMPTQGSKKVIKSGIVETAPRLDSASAPALDGDLPPVIRNI